MPGSAVHGTMTQCQQQSHVCCKLQRANRNKQFRKHEDFSVMLCATSWNPVSLLNDDDQRGAPHYKAATADKMKRDEQPTASGFSHCSPRSLIFHHKISWPIRAFSACRAHKSQQQWKVTARRSELTWSVQTKALLKTVAETISERERDRENEKEKDRQRKRKIRERERKREKTFL